MDGDVNNVPENLQMEVIELHAGLVLKSQFNNIALTDFYKFYLVEEKYTNSRAFSRKIMSFRQHIYVRTVFFKDEIQ
jgi:hypothetical protein